MQTLLSSPLVVRVQAEVRDRYAVLQPREQRIVLIAAVLLPLMILVFGFWLPMRDRVQALENGLPAMQAQLAEAQQLASVVAAAGGKAAPRGDLLTLVDQVARSANVRSFITRIKPQPGTGVPSVLVQLRKAPYADVVRFLSQMAEKGVASSRAKLGDVSNNGLVDADLTLVAG